MSQFKKRNICFEVYRDRIQEGKDLGVKVEKGVDYDLRRFSRDHYFDFPLLFINIITTVFFICKLAGRFGLYSGIEYSQFIFSDINHDMDYQI